MSRWILAALLLALAACGGDAVHEPDPQMGEPDLGAEDPQEGAWLTPVQHLARASLSLRGRRPSLSELRQVQQDPELLPVIVDSYLEDPGFGQTMRDMHNEIWQLRSYAHMFAGAGSLQGEELMDINQSLWESPLRLIEHVVVHNRPYSEVVTADYAVANGLVARIWGLEYDGDGQEWVRTRWDAPTDQPGPWADPRRPHAGILSDSFLFTRYDTTGSNLNRGRANAVSRSLLCFDFLEQEVSLTGEVDLSDPVATQDALRNNPACVTCHRDLDPLGQFFWIYDLRYNLAQVEDFPHSTFYHPERVELARQLLPGLRPGFFGQSEPEGDRWSVRELGQMIADDPRFAQCAAQRFYSYFAQVPRQEVSPLLAARLRSDFVDAGLDAKALSRAVVLSDEFRALDGEQAAGLLRVRPLDMVRTIEDLTGFSWAVHLPVELAGTVYGTTNVMADPLVGNLVLAGGVDSYQTVTPLHTYTATAFLAQRAFVHEAVGDAVRRELDAEPSRRRLLTLVQADDTQEGLIREQLAELHLRLFAEEAAPQDSSVGRSWELWSAALALSNDPARAWQVTLVAMLQDTRFVYY